jgi:hypothetical protein
MSKKPWTTPALTEGADEERLARLTALARKAYGQDVVVHCYCEPREAWSVRRVAYAPEDRPSIVVFVEGLRSFEALEAALLVLAGDLVLTGEERSLMRPDIKAIVEANVEVGMAYTSLLVEVERLASEWENRGHELGQWSTERALMEQLAAELRERAKGAT